MDGINFFLSGLRDKNFGKMGLRDQNNGKKIGINGSRIYHVTTLSISFALFEMVSSENYQYTLKLSQPLTNNKTKTKKRRIVLKS